MDTKIDTSQTTTKSSMPPILQQMAEQANNPEHSEEIAPLEEVIMHKLFTDMCKRLDRSSLKAACVNYNVWRSKQMSSNNKIA